MGGGEPQRTTEAGGRDRTQRRKGERRGTESERDRLMVKIQIEGVSKRDLTDGGAEAQSWRWRARKTVEGRERGRGGGRGANGGWERGEESLRKMLWPTQIC